MTSEVDALSHVTMQTGVYTNEKQQGGLPEMKKELCFSKGVL